MAEVGGIFGGLGYTPMGWDEGEYDAATGSPPGMPAQAAATGVPAIDGALGLPGSDLYGGLAGMKERELAGKDRMRGQIATRLEADRARATKALEATAIGPDELQPWDADKQAQKYSTSPVAAFGSLGSVFAMVASAFTDRPMENALNAGAAALTALKANDDESFKRAFEGWKVNTDLAVKRHNIQQQDYQNAITLMSTDMAAGRARLEMLAGKYGDEKALFLLRNGYDDDLMKMLEHRARAAKGLAEANQFITKDAIQRNILETDPGFNSGDPEQKLEAFNRIYGVKEPVEQQIMRKFIQQNPDATAEQMGKFRSDYFGYGQRPLGGDQQFIQKFWEDNPNATSQEFATAFAQFKSAQKAGGAGANVNLTKDRQIAAEIAAQKQKMRDEGKSDEEISAWGDAEFRRRQAATAAPSGNRIDDLKARYDKAEASQTIMSKAEKILNSKLGAAGGAGYANRLAESAGNLLGTKSTEYTDFARYISELKVWAQTVLMDRSGRPLSAEAAEMNRIIGGMHILDTTANVKSNFKHLRELYNTLKTDLAERIKGGGGPDAKPAPADPAAKPNWYKGLPGKQSEALGDDVKNDVAFARNPDVPSPPTQPKEWPPHPLDPGRIS